MIVAWRVHAILPSRYVAPASGSVCTHPRRLRAEGRSAVATAVPVTNLELLEQLNRLICELNRRVKNYRDADVDPATGDVAADEGLVLASRGLRLLDDAATSMRLHRRYFEQPRGYFDEEADSDAG